MNAIELRVRTWKYSLNADDQNPEALPHPTQHACSGQPPLPARGPGARYTDFLSGDAMQCLRFYVWDTTCHWHDNCFGWQEKWGNSIYTQGQHIHKVSRRRNLKTFVMKWTFNRSRFANTSRCSLVILPQIQQHRPGYTLT